VEPYRITIVNMPIRGHAKPNNVPMGVYYILKAVERAFGEYVNVRVLDLNLLRPVPSFEQVAGMLAKYLDTELFMLSGMVTTYEWQRWIAEWLDRHADTDCAIIGGGGLASNLEELALDTIQFDAICVGEGDKEVVRMVRDSAAETFRVPGIYRGRPVSHLDEIGPIPWNRVEGVETYITNSMWGLEARNSSSSAYAMKRSLNMLGSRGCPYACEFCNKDMSGGRVWRARSVDSIVGEMRWMRSAFNVDFIGFNDNNFTVSRRRLLDFCERVGNVGVRWGCAARFNNVDDSALLKRMAKAGCVLLGFGGESGDVKILNDMRKDQTPEDMARVLRKVRWAGIHPTVTWMYGWPGETREQVRATVRFLLEHAPENRCMFVATAYPHTPLWWRVESFIHLKFPSLIDYVRELEDATKPIMNYSAMSDNEFFRVADLVMEDRLEKI
jgi:radical SAM superfamily enzyme YgiQ (UPF0313 family)